MVSPPSKGRIRWHRGIWLLLAAAASLVPVVPPAGAQAPGNPHVSDRVLYRGPVALDDPADPLQGVAWTLGILGPPRTRLILVRNQQLASTSYDIDRGRVLYSYRPGQEDILPPQALTPSQYAGQAFQRELREAWIQGNHGVIQESLTRPERGGLVNLSLPFQIPFTEQIFGEGAPNLRVTGSEQVTISGASSWVVGQVTGERGGGSLFPKLDMRQRLNVNLQGTIGSKLFIDVAQNSDALTPLENSIKIRYRGDEDDVVQSVELGNTNLSLPPTQFVSYSARQEGLFGVKTEASVGNLDFTMIASRQEGQNGQATFRGGASERVIRINDLQYVRGKYFFLSDPDSTVPQIVGLRVYVDDRVGINDTQLGAQDAEAWIDPARQTPAGAPYDGSFHLLQEEEDYQVLNTGSGTGAGGDTRLRSMPILVLTNPLSPNHVLAVAYRQLVGADTVDVGTFTDFQPGETLQLKMIRPGEDSWGTDTRNNIAFSTWAPVRRLELKNVYDLRSRNIEKDSFELRIVQDVAGEGGSNPETITNEFRKSTPLLQVLGLDQKNNANPSNRTPDGLVDQEYIDLDNGLLFFPDLRPFDPSLTDIQGNGFRQRSWPVPAGATRPDTLGWKLVNGEPRESGDPWRSQETVPEIYDLLPNTLDREAGDFHIYTIEATVQSTASEIQLNTVGQVLTGSETVRLNGRVLERGADYSIFYDTGTITLKNPEATAPGADLVITYSYDSPFTRGSQSLVGGSVSTHADPNAKLSLSTSWLHESRGTPDRRPRLGQEPTVTTVGDLAARLRLQPWALTDLTDKIPLVSTDAPSRLEVNGAVGISLPNPNTRNVVYVDDMEGVELAEGPTVDRSSWFYTSAPLRSVEYLDTPGVPYIVRHLDPTARGQLLWFSPNTVKVADITPREDSQTTRDDQVRVLETIYIPQDGKGAYESWGGLVSPISFTGADVSDYQYVEVWINDYVNYSEAGQRRGDVLIDVGTVDEDAVWDPLSPPAPPNQILDLEDTNRSGGQIEYDEDLGLDGERNDKEPPPDPASKRLSPYSAQEDPAGDDRVPEIQTQLPERNPAERVAKYRGINGTENNKLSDSEDLNGDYFLDHENNYVEYRIDLSKPALIDVGRDYGVTDSGNGWRLYRIPLDEFHLSEGIPNLSQVRNLRMWFTGIPSGDTLDVQVASVEIVGNRWEATQDLNLAPDEIFNVAVVNNKETAGYTEPFGVERVNSVKEKEQSISLDFENFRSGKELSAFKRLPSVQDYTLYQTLAFYLNPQFMDISNDSVEFYIRFGSDASQDTLSYYEVATDISQNDLRRRADGWIDLRMQVTDLSRLKIGAPPGVQPDSFLVGPGDAVGGATAVPRAGIPGGLKVTVRGDPSFSRVRRVSIGLRNKSGFDLSKGSVWFDELRMGEVRRDAGWAGRWAANVQLADLANLQASVDLTSADFLRLGQTRGSGTEDLRYDLRGQIGLHKFVEGAHLSAPLTLRLATSRRTPKFRPNSDILFDGRDSGRDISESVERGATLSLNRELRGRSNPLTRYTIDPLRLRGSYTETFRDEVTRADTTTNLNGGVSYSLSLASLRPFRFFRKLELFPWPQSVNIDLAGSRSEQRVWTPNPQNPLELIRTNSTVTRTGVLNLTSTAQPIRGVTYSWRSSRDLIDEHFGPDTSIVRLRRPADRFLGVNLGREVSQSHGITFGYTPPYLGRTLKPRFNWTSGSSKNMAPSLTLEDYKDVVFDISNNNNATLAMSFPVGKIVGALTGSGDGNRRTPAAADTSRESSGGGDLRQLFTKIIRPKDIQTSASLGRRSAYSRINGSPPVAYVLGLSRDIGLGTDVSTVENANFNNSTGQTVTFRGNTSFTVLGGIGVDLEYQKRKDRNRTNDLAANLKDDTTWPEIRFNWGDIHKHLPLLPKLFSDFRIVNTTFSRVTNVSGTETEPRQNTQVTSRWNPLLSVQGTLLGGWRTIINANRSSTHGEGRSLGSASTTTDQSSTSYQLSLARKFHREGSGVGRDVDFKTDVTYSTTSSVSRSSYTTRTTENKEQNIRINTSAGIRLTRSMTGTFGLELSQNRRPVTDWTRRTVRVFFSTGFSF